ncbi:MAG: YihY/virulence factor BrkB family protein [Prevotella sp.]
MPKHFARLKRFVLTDIWRIGREDVSKRRYFFYQMLKMLILTVRFFTTRRVLDMASALTYSTLLAIVPILAVVFAVARGFGYSRYIEVWFRDALSSQPQAADTIISFVNSYLIHTKSGIFLGIGLLFMLFTVLMLTSNIEKTFNAIWQVKHPRSLFRTITDYMAMFFILPVCIVITSGLSIIMATVAHETDGYTVIGPMMQGFISFMPYVLMSIVFIALYLFMPNTKVKLSSVIVPGVMAGVAMQLLQLFYINSQLFLSGYNAIYGSFAALPLFMLWVQISWTICLFGAQLCYTIQNLDDYAFMAGTDEMSHRYRLLLSGILMGKVCRRFDKGLKPYTAMQLMRETGIPVRIIQDLLYDLAEVNLLSENAGPDRVVDSTFQPAESLDNITFGVMVDRLESHGKWSLDLDLRDVLKDHRWKEIMLSRKTYLDTLDKVYLRDF